MPNDFPPWAAVYQQSQRWLAAGCFETLAQDLRALLRLASGRSEEPTAAIIDSRTLRSTPESGTRAGYDGAKRKRGSKVHMAVDTLGHLLALHVTPADVGDRAAVGRLAADIQDATGDSVRLAYVDQGYTGEAAADAEVDPVWWSRSGFQSEASRCSRHARLIRLSSVARWTSWSAPVAIPLTLPASSNRRRSRSATG
jgi:transposase